MITKAILIKPADKWMVRVWEKGKGYEENKIIIKNKNKN